MGSVVEAWKLFLSIKSCCVVVLGLEYDKGISFITCGDHGVVFFESGLNRYHGSVFRLVVALCAGFVMKF